jgi:phenylpyruvate tautomerase PptA (4-oxalocrotonate tautomerase family)
MPIYQCSAQAGLLTDKMKAQVAAAITDAHVEFTGAPRVFVHVFFNQLPPGIAYSAGEPRKSSPDSADALDGISGTGL